MPVIKAQSAAPMIKEALVLDLGDIARQAEQIRAVAEARAARIIAEAQAQAAELLREGSARGAEEGRAQGLRQGLEQGRRQGREEALAQTRAGFEQLQGNWRAAIADWESSRQRLEQESAEQVLRLALRMAQMVVHRVIEVDSGVVTRQVAAALRHVLSTTDVVVHVCPADRPVLEEVLPELMAQFPQCEHLRLVDDPSVAVGGCVVRYGQGQVDAQVQTQLQRVVELLLPDTDAVRSLPSAGVVQGQQGPADSRPDPPPATPITTDAAPPPPAAPPTDAAVPPTQAAPLRATTQRAARAGKDKRV